VQIVQSAVPVSAAQPEAVPQIVHPAMPVATSALQPTEAIQTVQVMPVATSALQPTESTQIVPAMPVNAQAVPQHFMGVAGHNSYTPVIVQTAYGGCAGSLVRHQQVGSHRQLNP